MANSQDDALSQNPDLLAAVVLHTLVAEGRDGMTVWRMAIACERDPHKHAERREIETALQTLVKDKLAYSQEQPQSKEKLFCPTHAAIRAAELSF